jgi:hypothetical protein
MDKNQDPGSGIDIPDPQHWSHSIVTHRRQSKNQSRRLKKFPEKVFAATLFLCLFKGTVSRDGYLF